MSRGADSQGVAWARLAKDLASDLPGEWALSKGRAGLRTVLVREPVGWFVSWVGVDHVRSEDPLRVVAGVTPLVEPVSSLTFGWGVASDLAPWRAWFDLTVPDDAEGLRSFVLDHALPELDGYDPRAAAAAAEAAVADPELEDRFEFLAQAPGWRVVNDSGSPVGPAHAAAAWCVDLELRDEAAWYDTLVDEWKQGGRDRALRWLHDRRAETLDRLKLPSAT